MYYMHTVAARACNQWLSNGVMTVKNWLIPPQCGKGLTQTKRAGNLGWSPALNRGADGLPLRSQFAKTHVGLL